MRMIFIFVALWANLPAAFSMDSEDESPATKDHTMIPIHQQEMTDDDGSLPSFEELDKEYKNSCGERCNRGLACFDRSLSKPFHYVGLGCMSLSQVLKGIIPPPYDTLVFAGGLVITLASNLLAGASKDRDPDYYLWNLERKAAAAQKERSIDLKYKDSSFQVTSPSNSPSNDQNGEVHKD